MPPIYSGAQSAVLSILKSKEQCKDISVAVAQKAVITLGEDVSSHLKLKASWFLGLKQVLESGNLFLRVCWLNAIAGAWCTTIRMHDFVKWPCIFGCEGERDEFRHYLVCPVLWQFAREFLQIEETSIFIGERLGFVQPSLDKLRALAFVHSLYHACKNDSVCVKQNGDIQPAHIVQTRASEISRSVRHLVA